ncbi:MAG: MFS transporter [Planctomycetes bacterium]|nr:MFS transporter [Planctomycetota bacterium]
MAQFISGTGNSVFSTCIGFLVIYLLAQQGNTGGELEVGLTRAVDALPFLLFGAYAGVLVDRYSRRTAMLVSDLARAIILASIPALYFTGTLQWWMVLGAAFFVYTFTTFFNPARDALIPDLAAGRDLLKVNSFFQTSDQAAFLFGAGIVGLVLSPQIGGAEAASPEGISWLLILDALSFLFSFGCIWLIRVRETHTDRPRGNSISELRESISSAFKERRLRSLLFLTAVNNFFIMGPAIVGAMFLIKRDLGLEVWAFGVFQLCLGLGWVIGTLLIARFGSRIKTGKLVIAGMLLDGFTYIPFLWLDSYGAFLVAIFLHGLFIPLITVGRTTMIQKHYPRERLGRIFALVSITVQGFTAISAFATGWMLTMMSAKNLFFWGGLLGGICGLIGMTFKSLRETE